MMGQLLMKHRRQLQSQLPDPPIQCFPVSVQSDLSFVQLWLPKEDSYLQLLVDSDTIAAAGSSSAPSLHIPEDGNPSNKP